MESFPREIEPDRFLLDPNNYRFHDLPGYKPVVSRSRYAEPGVQERALQLLQTTESFELEALKDSIITNGYVPLEQLVVESFDEDENGKRYLVVEGNRRIAAIVSLLEEHKGGAVDLSGDVLDSILKLQAIEIAGSAEERLAYKQTIMAIRHIAGIKAWGAYQQAKLVVELYENEEHQFTKVAQRIGISAVEVGRRYRASKGLQQMEEDDEFGEFSHPKLYSFFHEAVSQPKVREWIGFSDETFSAENDEARRGFYELLSPRTIDEEKKPPKLENAYRQVRQLKDIVDKPVPTRILLDPEKPFEDAVRAAEDETVQDETGVLDNSLKQALRILREPSIDAWLNPSEQERAAWQELVGLVDKIRQFMDRE